MNSLERTRRAIRGQPVDRPPTFPILLAPACQLAGVKQRDYNLDAGIMADTKPSAESSSSRRPKASSPSSTNGT